MPKFSFKSAERLETCHDDLCNIFNTVVELMDCSILEGHRSKEDQNKAYADKKSQVQYPNSQHNGIPSMAVDVIPYPAPDWSSWSDFRYFGGYVLGISDLLFSLGITGHKLRWGGDWNRDGRVSDNNFNDYCHYELYLPEEEE